MKTLALGLVLLSSLSTWASEIPCKVSVKANLVPYVDQLHFDPVAESILLRRGVSVTRNESEANVKIVFSYDYKYADTLPGTGVRYDQTLKMYYNKDGALFTSQVQGKDSERNKRNLLNEIPEDFFVCDEI